MESARRTDSGDFFDIPVEHPLCVARVCAGHPERIKGRMIPVWSFPPIVGGRCPRAVNWPKTHQLPLAYRGTKRARSRRIAEMTVIGDLTDKVCLDCGTILATPPAPCAKRAEKYCS